MFLTSSNKSTQAIAMNLKSLIPKHTRFHKPHYRKRTPPLPYQWKQLNGSLIASLLDTMDEKFSSFFFLFSIVLPLSPLFLSLHYDNSLFPKISKTLI